MKLAVLQFRHRHYGRYSKNAVDIPKGLISPLIYFFDTVYHSILIRALIVNYMLFYKLIIDSSNLECNGSFSCSIV